MSNGVKALLIGALLHLVLFLVAALLVYLCIGQGALNEAVRASPNVGRAVTQHRGEILGWVVAVGLTGYAASTIWTLIAGARQVHQRSGAGAYVGGWTATLIAAIVVAVALLFLTVSASFGNEVAIGTRLLVEGLTFLFLVFAFWLSTAMLVKPAMQGAVPAGGVLPSIGA